MHQKSFSSSVILLSICFLILLGIIGFLLLKPRAQPSLTPSTQLSPPTIPQPPTQPIPPEEPADWRLYRNEEYGFEFRYPEEWGKLKIELPQNESDTFLKNILTQQIEAGVFSLGL